MSDYTSDGDARLELWEALCTCGGARKSPDVRMCRCLAPMEAGLDCEGCGAGVLLIKCSSSGHLFWGCSNYRKGGCKFTKNYGPPYDREAAQQLERMRQRRQAQAKREAEELACIVDPHELEWRNYCRCEGAQHLSTFECYMRSEGGCGELPLCPQCETQGMFLMDGRYGKYWQCRDRSKCKFHKSYVPHKKASSPPTKKIRTSESTEVRRVIQDVSNSAGSQESRGEKLAAKKPAPEATASATKKSATTPSTARHVTPAASTATGAPIVLSPEQKKMIEGKRQAAIEKCKRLSSPTGAQTVLSPEQKEMIEAKRLAAIARYKSPSSPTVAQTAVGATSSSSACKIPQNEPLYQAFCELSQLYQNEGNYSARATYSKVSEAIRELDSQVTAENAKGLAKGKTKVAHIGKASADKIHEFVTTGKIAKLEDKKKASSSS